MTKTTTKAADKSELIPDSSADGITETAFPEIDKSESTVSESGNCCAVPKRYVTILLLFVGMVIVHAQRVNVGVTVIQILDQTHHHGPAYRYDSETNDVIANLDWTPYMVGWLHAAFYVGLLISQVPCGYIVTKFPSHRLFGGCCMITFMLNFFVPLSIVRLGYGVTCTIRLLQGLVEGLVYPSCYDILRHWTLPEERSRMGASVLTGSYIGPTIGTVFSGLITYYAGWQYVFYVHGGVGILWYIFWLIFVFETPVMHPTITEHERKKMEEQQGDTTARYENERVPWKAIFTSLPVYSLIVCNFARSFVFYMLLTNQPAYLNTFKFSIAENGLFASLPYAFMALFCVISGSVADFLWTQPCLTATIIRKLFTCLGFGIAAMFFYDLALVSDRTLAVAFLTTGVGISGIAISGWQINHLDLAPRYAGVLVAITMTVGTVAGIINPIIVAALTQDQTLASWHSVFWLTGSILIAATIFYAIFGSGERQPWATARDATGAIIVPRSGDPLGVNVPKPYGTFHAQFNEPPPPEYQSPPGPPHGDDVSDDDEILNERSTNASSPPISDQRPGYHDSRQNENKMATNMASFNPEENDAQFFSLLDLTLSQPQLISVDNGVYPPINANPVKKPTNRRRSFKRDVTLDHSDSLSSQGSAECEASNAKKVDVGHVDDDFCRDSSWYGDYTKGNSQNLNQNIPMNDMSKIKQRSQNLNQDLLR